MRHGQRSKSSRTSLKVRNPLRSTSQRPRVMCLPTAALPFCMLLGRWRWTMVRTRDGDFHKWGYPEIHFNRRFSLINHPFWGHPQFRKPPEVGFPKCPERSMLSVTLMIWIGSSCWQRTTRRVAGFVEHWFAKGVPNWAHSLLERSSQVYYSN